MALWLFICNVNKNMNILIYIIKHYGKQILRRNSTIFRIFFKWCNAIVGKNTIFKLQVNSPTSRDSLPNAVDHKQRLITPMFQDFFPSSAGIFLVLSLLFCSQPKIEEIIPVYGVCCRLKSRISILKA